MKEEFAHARDWVAHDLVFNACAACTAAFCGWVFAKPRNVLLSFWAWLQEGGNLCNEAALKAALMPAAPRAGAAQRPCLRS